MTEPPSRSDATKRTILDVARQHFSAVGYAGTSTRAIAREVGINHSLIVYHFKTKDGLWRAVMDDLFAIFRAHAGTQPTTSDPVESLRGVLQTFTRFAAAHPELHRIMTIEGRIRGDRLHWLVDNHLRDFFESTCEFIRRGQAEGRVRPGNPAQLYYAAIGIAGTLATLAGEYEALSGESATSKESIASAVALLDALMFTDS